MKLLSKEANKSLIKGSLSCLMGVHVVSICSIYLCSLGIFGGVIIPAHAEHILRAVVELREAVELTVVVVNVGLVDTTERGLSLVGAVEERLENLPAQVKVSCASQMEPLCRWSDLILQVGG